jgi:hypothetical protein
LAECPKLLDECIASILPEYIYIPAAHLSVLPFINQSASPNVLAPYAHFRQTSTYSFTTSLLLEHTSSIARVSPFALLQKACILALIFVVTLSITVSAGQVDLTTTIAINSLDIHYAPEFADRDAVSGTCTRISTI